MLTELQFVSWKLPLVIVRQLSGVNECVVVSISGLNDLPADLVSGFLWTRIESLVCSRCFGQFFFLFLQSRLTASFVGAPYLLVFVKQEAQQQ